MQDMKQIMKVTREHVQDLTKENKQIKKVIITVIGWSIE